MSKTNSGIFFQAAQLIVALAGIFFISNLIAQEDESLIENRYLLVFSTSAEMKNRVPATQAEINQLLGLSMNGALHAGDSIGVWTFDKNVQVAQFPLVTWQPEHAADVAKALNKYIGKQRYGSTNNFDALLPVLERVIQSSPRLTVLIFCDGDGEISGTPYDDGINVAFKQRFTAQKGTYQPFIVVLRSQFGKYTGSSVNFTAGMVNLPPFPTIPKPEPPAPASVPPIVTNPPVAPPMPLVIIGTQVETNWEAYHFALTNVPKKTVPPASNFPVPNPTPTNAVAETENQSKNSETNSIAMKPILLATNTVVPPQNQSGSHNSALVLAVGFLAGAITLTAVFFFRSRREHGSLISRSMRK